MTVMKIHVSFFFKALPSREIRNKRLTFVENERKRQNRNIRFQNKRLTKNLSAPLLPLLKGSQHDLVVLIGSRITVRNREVTLKTAFKLFLPTSYFQR